MVLTERTADELDIEMYRTRKSVQFNWFRVAFAVIGYPIRGQLSTAVPFPHTVRPKTVAPARRRHFGVAVAITAETPRERRD